MSMGYCLDCKKIVAIKYLTETDEDGSEYGVPHCVKCMADINYCHDCVKWIPYNENTPLGETNGKCPFYKKVHAFDFICSEFE